MPCVFFFFIKGVQILSPSYYFRWLEALRGQQWNGKEHGSLLLELMLTESERSCHVFWQLTQWVWILQHKVGPFSLSTCLLGNVPSSCFHIDLITLPHWWAWHKTYFLYCCVHHIPSLFPALQHCYFGLQMEEDLVSAFPPRFPCLCYSTDVQKPFDCTLWGAVGLPGVWLPGFATEKLKRRGDPGLYTPVGGFTASEVKSLPSAPAGDVGYELDGQWQGRTPSPGLRWAPHWAMFEGMEAALPSFMVNLLLHANRLAKLCRDK